MARSETKQAKRLTNSTDSVPGKSNNTQSTLPATQEAEGVAVSRFVVLDNSP